VNSRARFAGWLAVLTTVLAGALLLAWPRTASAETRVYVIAIGTNRPPPSAAADAAGKQREALATLQYADDDAADFYSFTRGLATESTLLTVLDADSQVRFPKLAGIARPPTLVELRRAVAWHKERFEADRRSGHEPVLLLFYSGHGTRNPGEPAALTLLDGPLTQRVLYDEVLDALPARFVHLLIDACHAEAVVRPRDASAQTVDLSNDDVRALVARSTLDHFPHVGAVVAATSAMQAHEWDLYQRGVFTHEVLSGMRGAADVNGDGRVEYSELSAFLAAANRDVSDPRARLDVVVRPPSLDRRAPLVDLAKHRESASLVGRAAALGAFFVEDSRGNRIADVRAESGFAMAVALPAGELLHLRARQGEAELRLARGSRVAMETLALKPASTRARGSMDSALRRGLFAIPFGPVYYRGFVDSHASELVAVPLSDLGDVAWSGPATPDAPTPAPEKRSRTAGWVVTSLGLAAGATAGVFAGFAVQAQNDYNATQLERQASDAKNRFELDRDLAIGFGVGAAVGLGIGMTLLLLPDH
jgi:hypothetical protein